MMLNLRILFTVLFFGFLPTFSASYAAEDTASDDDSAVVENLDDNEMGLLAQCSRWSSNPWQCDRIPGCQFSRIYNQCVPSSGPVQPGACSNYNHNYSQCVRAGCNFDGNTGACYRGGQPNPQPNFCNRYDYNQYQCQRSGCFYDGRSGQCRRQGGGGNPGGRSWACTAVDAGTEEHGGGHPAYAYDQVSAQRQALAQCQRYHGRCRIRECHQQ